MDFINKLFDKFPQSYKTILDHNRWKTLAVAVSVGFVGFLGCESRTQSPLHPDKMLSRNELRSELQGVVTQYEIGFQNLDAKDALKQKVGELLTSTVGPLLGQYAGLGVGAVSLFLGGGAVLDKRRADKQITELKSKIEAETGSGTSEE